MDRKSLTRPPRPKRPPEVVRHVDDSLEALRRMAAARKDKAGASMEPRPKRGPEQP